MGGSGRGALTIKIPMRSSGIPRYGTQRNIGRIALSTVNAEIFLYRGLDGLDKVLRPVLVSCCHRASYADNTYRMIHSMLHKIFAPRGVGKSISKGKGFVRYICGVNQRVNPIWSPIN
jgi:hypothetical protein